jgi:hypothetical protein
MSELSTRVPFLPDKISCKIEFAASSVSRQKQEEKDETSPTAGSIDQFQSVAQTFVTYMQVLWQYTHEVGTVAERTSLTNLARLPSLLKDIEKRRNDAAPDEVPVATIVFAVEDRKKEQQHKKSFPVFELEHANKLGQCLTQHEKALRLLNETVLQQMVNAWERALGDLVAWKLRADPDAIPKDRTLSYSQILTFADFDEARRHVVEEEVADFLKSKTTVEQLKYFKDEFGADFRSQFPDVGKLCEIVLRRHAVVHAGGMASSEYCRRVASLKNLSDKPAEKGKPLPIPSGYIKRAWSVIYSAGVVLTHSVAKSHARRKKCKKDEEDSDSFLINAAFNVIKTGQYEAAKTILCYAHGLRLASSGSNLMVIVNLAQAHKWSGDDAACRTLLDGQDWASSSANFRLCVAALREDEDAFAQELEIVAKEETVGLPELFEWPVFQRVRKREDFLDVIRTAYGEDVKLPTDSKQPKLLDFEPTVTISELLKGIVSEMAELPESAMGNENDPTR